MVPLRRTVRAVSVAETCTLKRKGSPSTTSAARARRVTHGLAEFCAVAGVTASSSSAAAHTCARTPPAWRRDRRTVGRGPARVRVRPSGGCEIESMSSPSDKCKIHAMSCYGAENEPSADPPRGVLDGVSQYATAGAFG